MDDHLWCPLCVSVLWSYSLNYAYNQKFFRIAQSVKKKEKKSEKKREREKREKIKHYLLRVIAVGSVECVGPGTQIMLDNKP